MRRCIHSLIALAISTLAWAEAPAHRVLQLAAVGNRPYAPVVTALAYSEVGNVLAAGGDDHAIRIVRLEDQSLAQTLTGHSDWVRTLCFSPDGTRLVSAGNDGLLLVWNRAADWALTQRRVERSSVTCTRYSPLGQSIATCGFRSELIVIDSQAQNQIAFECGCNDLRTLAFSPDGQYIVIAGRTGDLHVVLAASMKLVSEIPTHRSRVRHVEFLANSSKLVSCAEDGTIVATDLSTGKRFSETKIAGCKLHCFASLGGDWIAAGGSDNLIHLVDVGSGKLMRSWEGHTGSVAALVVCGSTLASASFDTTIRLWDLKNLHTPESRVAVDAGEAGSKPTTEARLPQSVTPR